MPQLCHFTVLLQKYYGYDNFFYSQFFFFAVCDTHGYAEKYDDVLY